MTVHVKVFQYGHIYVNREEQGEWKQPLSQKGAYVSENAKGKC